MDNAIVVALGAVSLAVVIGAYLLGYADGMRAGIWEERAEHNAMIARVRDEEFEWHRQATHYVRERAFARAADAVGIWPHRIDRRADLMRHLEALATAPELGAATPNPEREPQEEPRPQDTADSPSRVPSAAPVPAGEDAIDPEQTDERVVDIYRNEGFL